MPVKPRVFISYSHDSEEHARQVLALSERLRRDGLHTILDQYRRDVTEIAPLWMQQNLLAACYVVCVCSSTYYRRFHAAETSGVGLGVAWEGHLIIEELYRTSGRSQRFIPVLLDDADVTAIPEALRMRGHYRGDTDDGYQGLRRALEGRLGVEPGPVGKPVSA